MTPERAWTRGYPALLTLLTAAVIAVEAVLVEPGHLIAAQIADAALVLLIVNLALRDSSRLTARGRASVMALRALALVPLIRVASLGLPIGELGESGGLLVLALALAVAVVVLAPSAGIARRSFIALPLTPSVLFAAAAGLPLGLLVYLAGGDALAPQGAPAPDIALAIVAGACAAVAQELVFRGAVQLTFQRVAGSVGALGATVLFAATHLGAGSTALVLSYALAGLVFAHGVRRTGALGGAILGHLLLVLSAGAIWPLALGTTPPGDLEGTPGIVLWAVIVLGAALTLATPSGDLDDQP